jgi:hypothetical protein
MKNLGHFRGHFHLEITFIPTLIPYYDSDGLLWWLVLHNHGIFGASPEPLFQRLVPYDLNVGRRRRPNPILVPGPREDAIRSAPLQGRRD